MSRPPERLGRPFMITRVFDAPRELVWQALDADGEENATFDGARTGMTQGWSGTMDLLAAYLARLRQRD